MGFGKKKAVETTSVDQTSVPMLAAKALAKNRNSRVRMALRLHGETPILMHRWSQKAILQMLGKMVGQVQVRDAKDLTKEYEASYFRNEKQEIVIPCRVLKAAIVNGAITTQGVTTKAELKRDLRVLGYTTPITLPAGQRVEMDVRPVSNNGTPDIRARALVPEGWTADIVLEFPTTLSIDKIISAVDGAGASIGICDWRPDKGGDFGTFTVTTLENEEISRILIACASPEEMYVIPPEFMHAHNAAATDQDKKVAALVDKVNGDAAGAKTRKAGKTNGAVAEAEE